MKISLEKSNDTVSLKVKPPLKTEIATNMGKQDITELSYLAKKIM